MHSKLCLLSPNSDALLLQPKVTNYNYLRYCNIIYMYIITVLFLCICVYFCYSYNLLFYFSLNVFLEVVYFPTFYITSVTEFKKMHLHVPQRHELENDSFCVLESMEHIHESVGPHLERVLDCEVLHQLL